MSRWQVIGLSVLVIVLFLILTGVYTVTEGQKALVLRLGQIVIDPATQQAKVVGPGLHFKVPVINQIRTFDARLQTFPVESSRILTEDQKYVLVDYYIKWRINDVALYYQRTGGVAEQAEVLLQQQVNDALRAAFGQRTLTDMVSGERINVMALLTQSANQTAKNLGILVVDVRIKSIDLPKEVSDRVYNRMRTRREQVATELRSEGKAQAEAVKASADAEAQVKLATAKTEAAKLRAQGIAEAGEVYTVAYTKDPAFYYFYGSLEAYRDVFNSKQDVLVLQPNNQFFKYFNGTTAAPVSATKK